MGLAVDTCVVEAGAGGESACINYDHNHYHHVYRRQSASSMTIDCRARTRSLRFRAMGTAAEVFAVGGGDDVLAGARAHIEELEQRWSRFIPSSEVSLMNAGSGRPSVVSDETFALISTALDGWQMTDGLFDPTLLGAVIDAGYDRSFETMGRDARARPSGLGHGAGRIALDPSIPSITMPPGVGFDPGGIGKGLAADMVVAWMMQDRAEGACVNIGGDLRAEGAPPGEDGWTISIDDPFGRAPSGTIMLSAGAVATSSVTRRVWKQSGEDRHHVIDPSTGTPADREVVSATVIAGEAWVAEVLAKALLLEEHEAAFERLSAHGATGLTIDREGATRMAPGMERFLA